MHALHNAPGGRFPCGIKGLASFVCERAMCGQSATVPSGGVNQCNIVRHLAHRVARGLGARGTPLAG